jgi:hypothetical protein
MVIVDTLLQILVGQPHRFIRLQLIENVLYDFSVHVVVNPNQRFRS